MLNRTRFLRFFYKMQLLYLFNHLPRVESIAVRFGAFGFFPVSLYHSFRFFFLPSNKTGCRFLSSQGGRLQAPPLCAWRCREWTFTFRVSVLRQRGFSGGFDTNADAFRVGPGGGPFNFGAMEIALRCAIDGGLSISLNPGIGLLKRRFSFLGVKLL